MKLKKIKKVLLRRRLSSNFFYEDVIFDDKITKKNVKKSIKNWINNLHKYKDIKIEKFKDLIITLDEIVFPIAIKKSYGHNSLDIRFIDDEGKQYYMINRTSNNYYTRENYIIGRRNNSLEPLIDRDFHYKICNDGSIELMETGAMKLKQDGTNDNIIVDFCYDSEGNTTEAKLRSYASKNKIKIQYPTMSKDFDQMVLKFLFDINEDAWYYYDVVPILKWILTSISDKDISISIIAEVEGEISSEIEVVNGNVQKYTTTQIVNEGEVQIKKRIFAKTLNEFLTENGNY